MCVLPRSRRKTFAQDFKNSDGAAAISEGRFTLFLFKVFFFSFSSVRGKVVYSEDVVYIGLEGAEERNVGNNWPRSRSTTHKSRYSVLLHAALRAPGHS